MKEAVAASLDDGVREIQLLNLVESVPRRPSRAATTSSTGEERRHRGQQLWRALATRQSARRWVWMCDTSA